MITLLAAINNMQKQRKRMASMDISRLWLSFKTRFQTLTTNHIGGMLVKLKFYSPLRKFYFYRPTRNDRKKKWNFLVQEKGIFNSEIEYIFDENSNCSITRYNRPLAKLICNHVYGEKINQNNYLSKISELQKKEYHDSILFHLMKEEAFDAVLFFNFGGGECAALMRYFKSRAKVFCLHKEGVMSNRLLAEYTNVLMSKRDKYHGDFILVYNTALKKVLLSTGHYDASKIFVVGAPRFDLIHKVQRSPIPSVHEILVFFPSRIAQLPNLFEQEHDFDWQELCREFVIFVKKIAEIHEQTKIVVKLKARDEGDFITNFSEYDNVHVDTKTLSTDLLKTATLCLGFNSAALVESACAGIPTFQCCFGEAKNRNLNDWIINYGCLVLNSYDPVEAERLLYEHLCKNPKRLTLTSKQKEDLNRLVGNADGKTKERVRKIISQKLA